MWEKLSPKTVPLLPFFKLREEWFYIGYIERIFQKTITSLQNYRQRVKTSPWFKLIGLPLEGYNKYKTRLEPRIKVDLLISHRLLSDQSLLPVKTPKRSSDCNAIFKVFRLFHHLQEVSIITPTTVCSHCNAIYMVFRLLRHLHCAPIARCSKWNVFYRLFRLLSHQQVVQCVQIVTPSTWCLPNLAPVLNKCCMKAIRIM